MSDSSNHSERLISVIIPCYNHGRYLANAINSILNQVGYSNYEIIVVDDGSVDDTRQVCESFAGVKYIYQQNAGLSAARNTGIKNSNGEYLAFQDADDWFLPNALSINAKYLDADKNLAFVSGAYEYLEENYNHLQEIKTEKTSNYYCHLLEGNYIAMHGTVLYRRWAFDHHLYDTSLKACEDYDIYLKIARDHPVFHHTELIAVYRIHNSNMSGNILLMIDSATRVLKKQEPLLRNNEERACYQKGIIEWHKYYAEELYKKLLYQHSMRSVNKKELFALKKYDYNLYRQFRKKVNKGRLRNTLKQILPQFIVKALSK